MNVPRPCLDCGEPSTGTRCDPCRRERQRGRPAPAGKDAPTTTERGYGGDWQKLSRRARRLTPWCADAHLGDCYGVLTTDHLPGAWEKWEAGRRLTFADVEVVCTAHNTRRGRRRPAADTPAETSGDD